MALELQTAPSLEPITISDAKQHMRVDVTDDDSYIENLITVARLQVEAFLNRQLINATWLWTLDHWPDEESILLPLPPLSSVTSITYLDTGGTRQTWTSADYDVDTTAEPGKVSLAYNASYPSERTEQNSIQITYVAGYGAAATSVPENIRQAIRMTVAHYYEHREPAIMATSLAPIPWTAEHLMWPDRIVEFA